jgi:hypothetical protein
MGDSTDPAKPSEFAGSMAEAIENALLTLLTSDGIQGFATDTNSQDARDRRRLLVAIAQGVLGHMAAHPQALQITFVDSNNNTITASVNINLAP